MLFKDRNHINVGVLACVLSPTLCDPLWTVACQAPLSMGFFMQEYWSGVSFSSPGESSRPRDQTGVSCIAGRPFTV